MNINGLVDLLRKKLAGSEVIGGHSALGFRVGEYTLWVDTAVPSILRTWVDLDTGDGRSHPVWITTWAPSDYGTWVRRADDTLWAEPQMVDELVGNFRRIVETKETVEVELGLT